MLNKLLLTSFESAIIVVVGIVVLIFIYLMLGRLFVNLKERIMNSRSKKIIEKVSEDSGEVQKTEQPKPENKKNKYNEVLEKVHQNREQYFKEVDTVAESHSGETTTSANIVPEQMELDKPFLSNEFSDDDVELLEKIDFANDDDFSFLDGQQEKQQMSKNFSFADDFSPENFDENSNFADEFKRKRMLKRNQTISSEINSCSTRIKAIIALDILNKTKF